MICNIQEYFTITETPTQTLTNNPKPIKYIFHTADIHIKRTPESMRQYKDVLQTFIQEIGKVLIEFYNSEEEINILYAKLEEAQYIVEHSVQVYNPNAVPVNDDALIVICGDVLDSHLTYGDLSLKLCKSMMIALSLITPVVVIHGNHDVSPQDNQREGLSAIIANIPNVHLLMQTGNYVFNDHLTFNVFSILDPKLPDFNTPECQNRRTVGLYHGKVTCTNKLENSQITYDNLPSSVFKSDITLLGDAHTFNYRNKERTIAYSGSLIQQSILEDLSHGFVLWNLETLESKFIPVANKVGYVRFIFENDEMIVAPELVEENIVHCRCINSTRELCTNAVREYVKQQGKQYINVIPEMEVRLQANIGIEYNKETQSLIDSDCQMSLINQYNDQIPDKRNEDFMKEILKIHNNLFQKVKKVQRTNTVTPFKINQIYFSNIFNYGPNNHLLFDDLPSIVGVNALNQSGKTNLFRIIEISLFGPCEKYPIKSIINNTSNGQMITMIELEQGDNKYCIIRANTNAFLKPNATINPNSYNKMTLALSILNKETDFYEPYDSTLTNDQIEELIVNLFGTRANLNNIFMMLQHSKGTCFLDAASPYESFKYFAQHYDFNIYEELWKMSGAKLNKKDAELKKLKKTIIDKQKNISKNSLIVTQDKLKTFIDKGEELDSQLEAIKDEIKKLHSESTSQYINVTFPKLSSKSLEELEDKLNMIQLKIGENSDNLENMYKTKRVLVQNINDIDYCLQTYVTSLTEIANQQQNSPNKLPLNLTQEKLDTIMLNKDIDTIDLKIREIEMSLSSLKTKINELESGNINKFLFRIKDTIEYLSSLITVNKNKIQAESIIEGVSVDKFITRTVEDLNKQIIKEQKNLTSLQEQQIKLKQKRLANFNDYLRNNILDSYAFEEVSKLVNEIIECNNQRKDCMMEIQTLEESIITCNQDQAKLDMKQKDIILVIKNIQNNAKINDDLEKLNAIESNLNKNIKDNAIQIKKCENDVTKFKDYNDSYEADCKLNAELEVLIEKYRFYKCMMSPNGIPKLILKNLISKVEIVANNILSTLTNTTIKFVIQDGSPNTTKDYEAYPHIKIYNTDAIPVDMANFACGFERFIIDFSVRTAVAQLLNLQYLDFIVIDEFLSVLDKIKVENLTNFFNYVSQHYSKCFLISHNSEIQKYYKGEIQLDKRINGTSYLVDNINNIKNIRQVIANLVDIYIIDKQNEFSSKKSIDKTTESINKQLEEKIQNKGIGLVGLVTKKDTVQVPKPRKPRTQVQKSSTSCENCNEQSTVSTSSDNDSPTENQKSKKYKKYKKVKIVIPTIPYKKQ